MVHLTPSHEPCSPWFRWGFTGYHLGVEADNCLWGGQGKWAQHAESEDVAPYSLT